MRWDHTCEWLLFKLNVNFIQTITSISDKQIQMNWNNACKPVQLSELYSLLGTSVSVITKLLSDLQLLGKLRNTTYTHIRLSIKSISSD